MRSLNLDQLRALIEVIEQGGFSAAARRLNLTQPAVSLQVRELERRFGVRLIERMGRRAHATAPGSELAEAARRIFRECEQAEAAMRRFREGWIGRVHIGATNTAMMYDLPPVLRQLRQEHPGIELHITNMPTRESIEQVLRNGLDLALVTLPVANRRLRITPLRWQQLVAIFPAGTQDLPDRITPAYVARQTLIIEYTRGAVHALIMRWLAGQMPLPRPPMHLGTVEALKTAVASSVGMSIVPDVAVAQPAPDLLVRPLQPPVPCTLALIEHRNKPNEPAIEIVRNALLEMRTPPAARKPRASGAGRAPARRARRPARRAPPRRSPGATPAP
jgi:DNA-binding transcriptional LysR family regulator